LLWQAAIDGSAIGPTSFAKGGLGGVTQALLAAAKSFGVEVRTQSEVTAVESGDKGKVVLSTGEVVESRVVVSNADPRTTLLKLVDPVELDPGFLLKVNNYRTPGATAKINLALSELPAFNGLSAEESQSKLAGRIQVGPEIDYLEKAFDAAKYGEFSDAPYLDITIPSLTDPSLTPKGGHVMSIQVQFAPYKLRSGDWASREEEFAEKVIDVLSKHAPRIREFIVGKQVITPARLESEYGLSGGHIHHGEQTLDQVFTFRPLIGWAQYRTPLQRLYLCGAGTHPGGGITGMPGANAAREVLKDLKSKK
jgi:phytoene dehydrogenase-like protein